MRENYSSRYTCIDTIFFVILLEAAKVCSLSIS